MNILVGDLFGPYYVQAEEKHWPEFLTKKPAKVRVFLFMLSTLNDLMGQLGGMGLLVFSFHDFDTRSSSQMARSSSSLIDIWMHGSCTLWAPDVHMAVSIILSFCHSLEIV